MLKYLRRIALVLFAVLTLAAAAYTVVKAESVFQNRAILYFFWGDGCPHCATAKPFLDELEDRYPGLEVRRYEVWYNQENQKIWFDVAGKAGVEPKGVPSMFLGEHYWEGFSSSLAVEIEDAVKACLETGCPDAGEGFVEDPNRPPLNLEKQEIEVPLFGTINLSGQSLLVSTLLIAFVDGFNPCSLWVLSMLMALVVHTGSRRKIFIIGAIFIFVTALVYALFIAGLFSLLSFVSYLKWIQVVVALISLVFAVINIKDYFWYKQGVSLTISDEEKPGLYQRMRKVVLSSDSFVGLASATVALAAGVSLVEFSCTAGFPVLWTNLLTAQNVTIMSEGLTFGLLLLVYMLIYQLDEMVIFLSVVFTLKASRVEEKEGRFLKLVGGMLMLTLAGVMLINPALMNNIGTTLLIFAIAFAATLLVILLHRKVLPRYGIWIGTEEQGTGKRAKRRVPRKAH